MTPKETKRIRELFHKAWGNATMSPEYDKPVWVELDNLLAKLLKPKPWHLER